MTEFGLFLINTDAIKAFFQQPTIAVVWDLFAIGGYLAFVYLLLYVALMYYQEYRENKNTASWSWVVLAVDVPPMNEQTPKAIESMFIHLAGAYDKPNIGEKFRGGYKQRWFSFEIISIEGYIQFVVRTEEAFRDLVEASIYAQYPEAEITEVQDYVDYVPQTYPNDTHDIVGIDFGLANDDAYPIRTYKEFEHNISKDDKLKDPMSAVLESFSRIGPGEQLWLQILIEPISNSWKEKAIKKIKEIIGDTSASAGKGGFGSKYVDALGNATLKTLEGIGDQVFGREAGEGGGKDSGNSPLNQIQFLTPGQKKVVELMEEKINQVGFKTKIRAVYVARKEVFRPTRAINSLIGSMSQFNSNQANSIVPKSSTSAHYFFKNQRVKSKKNFMMKSYKKRKISAPGTPFVMTVEELATIWHFPLLYVATPMVQKVTAKQSEPPVGLPVERISNIPGLGGAVVEPNIGDTPTNKPKNNDVDAYGYSSDMNFG